MKRIPPRLAALALAAALAGCGTLPDGRPFADASSALSSSVRASGQAVSDSLRDAGSLMRPSEARDYEELAQSLDAAWAERIKATQGAVAYSQAIAELIAAGNSGAQTARQVGDNLEALAAAAGISMAAPVVGVAGNAASFLFERIALIRASHKLEDAVLLAQPAVDQIAAHLAFETTAKLKPILKAGYKNSISAIKDGYSAEDDFAKNLDARRDNLLQTLLKNPENESELVVLERLRAHVSPQLQERDQKIEQVLKAYKIRLALVNTLAGSAPIWAAAHRDLAWAIQEKRKVSVIELQETVGELKELIKQVRTL
jgi:hypothetical protein